MTIRSHCLVHDIWMVPSCAQLCCASVSRSGLFNVKRVRLPTAWNDCPDSHPHLQAVAKLQEQLDTVNGYGTLHTNDEPDHIGLAVLVVVFFTDLGERIEENRSCQWQQDAPPGRFPMGVWCFRNINCKSGDPFLQPASAGPHYECVLLALWKQN